MTERRNRTAPSPHQLPLFEAVAAAYAEAGSQDLDNQTLYQEVARRTGVAPEAFRDRVPVGRSRQLHSPLARAARWAQQTLKCEGLLERVDRGVWRLTETGRQRLTQIQRPYILVAFSTDLGVALWGHCEDVFAGFAGEITLCLTSPPYPLAKPRAYGNPSQADYVDFLCRALEPVVGCLADGGSLVLNVSNDVFERGSPARSLYRERLVIALHDRLGLHKMDELVWHNPTKPPGPVQWASIHRYHLNVAWEPLLWLTNNPRAVKADNRRVLEPHTDRHRQLQANGGTTKRASHSDGAYRRPPGAYGRETPGRIPRNVLRISHTCPDQRAYKRAAAELGVPAHGAPFPLRLADFLVRYLSDTDDLVADPFAGSMTVGRAAEGAGRRWVCTDIMGEYACGAAERFRRCEGFWLNPELDACLGLAGSDEVGADPT